MPIALRGKLNMPMCQTEIVYPTSLNKSMEQFAPLIGIGLGGVVAYVVWQSVEYPYRKKREEEMRAAEEEIRMGKAIIAQAQQNQQLAKNAYPAIGGFTGYGPTDTRYNPYGLNKPKDNNQSLKDGLKKLL